MAYQYAGLPRATANIRNYVAQAVADNFLEQLANCFTLDFAVGPQLDIIGKYIGVNRVVPVPLNTPYFGFWDYEQADPSLQNPNGFYDYANGTTGVGEPVDVPAATTLTIASGETVYFSSSVVDGDLVIDGDFIQSQFVYAEFYSYLNASTSTTTLSDGQYRFLLRLQIVLNSSNGALASIQEFLKTYFGGQVTVVDNTNMTLTYYVSPAVPLPADVLTPYLPRPMGVRIDVIST